MAPLDQSAKESFGYVLDVPYTWSYFPYQSPILLSYVARLNGFDAPDPTDEFTHCDLGCGNGVTSNLLAAAYPQAEFYGVDFNSDHIDNARALADQSGLRNVTFLDASFDDLDADDLPQFDYITLHGVYSWVSADIRAHVDRVIDKMLKPGALVYLCYNTLPGAANLTALWKMMQEFSAAAEGDTVTRTTKALNVIKGMRRNNARYFRENPTAGKYFDKMAERDARYLVHEFANGHYEPLYFSDVVATFQQMGLTFAGSAKIYRNRERNYLSSRHMDHLNGADTPEQRESRASYLRNESFRWDVFRRGEAATTGKAELPLKMYFGAVRDAEALPKRASAGRRRIDVTSDIAKALFDVAGSGQFCLQELYDHPGLGRFGPDLILETLNDFVAADLFLPLLAPYLEGSNDEAALLRLTPLVNRKLIDRTLRTEGKAYVCSPITGQAQRLNFINGLLLLSMDGKTLAESKSEFDGVLARAARQSGHPFISAEDAASASWRSTRIESFVRSYLPRLLKTGVLVRD